MGYSSEIFLENVRIKPEHRRTVREYITTHKDEGSDFGGLIQIMRLNQDGLLKCVGSNSGKWHDHGTFANWLKEYCEPGGRITFVGEDDKVWGWEFDGKGNVKEAEYREGFTPPEEQVQRGKLYQLVMCVKILPVVGRESRQQLFAALLNQSLGQLIELAVMFEDKEFWNIIASLATEEVAARIEKANSAG